MAQKLAKCPDCGYTEQDAKLHLDHYLCKNSGNAPWEKKSEPRTPAAPETQRKEGPHEMDCISPSCGGCSIG